MLSQRDMLILKIQADMRMQQIAEAWLKIQNPEKNTPYTPPPEQVSAPQVGAAGASATVDTTGAQPTPPTMGPMMQGQ